MSVFLKFNTKFKLINNLVSSDIIMKYLVKVIYFPLKIMVTSNIFQVKSIS